MRIAFPAAIAGALIFAPAAAFAWVPFQPDLPEEVAVDIAYQHGVVMIEDVDPTLDADWHVEGRDAYGDEVELIIDGRTGAIESAEMESN